jgi:hypothetical protein
VDLILLVQNLEINETHTKVPYLLTFFSTPLSSAGFVTFVMSSLACDAVLVSYDYTSILTRLTIMEGIQIHRPIQKLLDADDQMLCVLRAVHYIPCRYR